jgi:hypothetical protein
LGGFERIWEDLGGFERILKKQQQNLTKGFAVAIAK